MNEIISGSLPRTVMWKGSMRTWGSSGHCTSVQQADRDLNSGERKGGGDIAALDHRAYVAKQQGRDAEGGQLEDQGDDPPDHDVQQKDAGRPRGAERDGKGDDCAAQPDAGRDIAAPHQ